VTCVCAHAPVVHHLSGAGLSSLTLALMWPVTAVVDAEAAAASRPEYVLRASHPQCVHSAQLYSVVAHCLVELAQVTLLVPDHSGCTWPVKSMLYCVQPAARMMECAVTAGGGGFMCVR
jgi:hypothetical protein